MRWGLFLFQFAKRAPLEGRILAQPGQGSRLCQMLTAPLRQVAGGEPVARLNARLNAASDS